MPAGIPLATCLNCGEEHRAFYASQAHDCWVKMAEKKPYWHWLLDFQSYGYGVLKTPSDAKFPWHKEITGRTATTFLLQSDLNIGPGTELDTEWYASGEFAKNFPLWWNDPLTGELRVGAKAAGHIGAKAAEDSVPVMVDPGIRNEAWLKKMQDQGFGVGKLDPAIAQAKIHYARAQKEKDNGSGTP